MQAKVQLVFPPKGKSPVAVRATYIVMSIYLNANRKDKPYMAQPSKAKPYMA